MTAPDVERLAEVICDWYGWLHPNVAATQLAQRIVASDVWAESMAQAWDEGKHSEHIPACRLGDGDCTCPNPYRTDPSDD